MDTLTQELQKAIDYVRQTFAEQKIKLDYTRDTVKHLDTLFDNEFKDGKLKKPDGSFAKYQGLIMTGVSGYIAQVILKNTENTQLVIDPGDQNWFMNFKVATAAGLFVQPGQRVIKRILKGEEMELYAYVLVAIKYFSLPPGITGNSPTATPDNYTVDTTRKKPWWKMW